MSHDSTEPLTTATGQDGGHPVNVVLCWHMHQPQYQDQLTKAFKLPWTYLHAIKDYIDMATIIERTPQAKAVINFTPVLLDQIDEYIRQFSDYFREGVAFKEPLLDALASHILPASSELRLDILKQCIRANEKRFIHRFVPYGELVAIAKEVIEKPYRLRYLNDQFYFDLLVWYHLVWLGETVRDTEVKVDYLIDKTSGYLFEDRLLLLQIMGDLIKQVVPKYRNLVKNGQVELSFTPDKHPITPLLIDFTNAKKASPDSPIPEHNYPGGLERAERHISNGISIFKKHFHNSPKGCWPSEGGLCKETLNLLAKHKISWAASGGGVLGNSLSHARETASPQPHNRCIHNAFQVDGAKITCFFRDDNLSDLIGFTYSTWNPNDAVANMVHHIENIRRACGKRKEIIVPIILDGENCWEHYENNGVEFLTALYQRLANHPDFHLTTFSEYLSCHYEPDHLHQLVPGSWVYGNFSTWMGDASKNKGWELLCQAKRLYDKVIASGELDEQQQTIAEHQLAICEGSDWFWWFGDYNPADSVSDFDVLYRTHLRNLYRILGKKPPEELNHVISEGSGTPENDGVMRRSS